MRASGDSAFSCHLRHLQLQSAARWGRVLTSPSPCSSQMRNERVTAQTWSPNVSVGLAGALGAHAVPEACHRAAGAGAQREPRAGPEQAARAACGHPEAGMKPASLLHLGALGSPLQVGC